jgi:hypothetical protein
MADFTKTITNSVNLFGGSPSSKWGQSVLPYTMTWGSTKWGEGTFSLVIDFRKIIENSLTPTTDIIKNVQKIISENLDLSQDISSEVLNNGAWRVVFISDTINIRERDTTTWSSQSANTVSYSCGSAGSTNWT